MENDKLDIRDSGTMWLTKDLKDVLQEVYDHYRSVVRINERLREENERLKSETYKDEELAKMKAEHDKMKDEYYRGFPISEKEGKKIKEWMEKQTEGEDFKSAIGGRFHYEFTSTSIGTIGYVIDGVTKERFCFRELS